MADPKKSERPEAEKAAAAAALGQDLIAQLQHDFSAQAKAAEKARVTATTDALIGQLQHDFVTKEREKKQAGVDFANALLNKVTRDFGSIAPPAPPPSVTAETDAQLEAAAGARLTAEEMADLDAMTAPTGFWGKLFARFGRKKEDV